MEQCRHSGRGGKLEEEQRERTEVSADGGLQELVEPPLSGACKMGAYNCTQQASTTHVLVGLWRTSNHLKN
jgi:hypothetical protein